MKGDWAERRPHVRPGGWAFQYANPHYPDLDDTAVVVMAMDRMRQLQPTREFDAAIARGREWIEGLISSNGGWAAFDADNTYYYLNNIPFADHGALLDPPTEDVTARCVSMLAQLGDKPGRKPGAARAPSIICATPSCEDGSWYGRWGMNYIYGTWSVLCALNAAGLDPASDLVREAADWLVVDPEFRRRMGRGRDELQARLPRLRTRRPARASQTAWALLGLMAAGRGRPSRRSSAASPISAQTQDGDGFWTEARFTATGFPARVLSALSRLSEIFSAVGAGPLPQPEIRQQRVRVRVRYVTRKPRC